MTLRPNFDQAAQFLRAIDRTATSFTFQTFDDDRERQDGNLARVLEANRFSQKLISLYGRGAGIFLTIIFLADALEYSLGA